MENVELKMENYDLPCKLHTQIYVSYTQLEVKIGMSKGNRKFFTQCFDVGGWKIDERG